MQQAYSVINTAGRMYQEDPPMYRSEFERDRDRIIHSKAFRRMQFKTQVLVAGFGDDYRTRLTHSLEVAQVGKSIATHLGLNVPLVEAICLGHDLGHPPFGHAGQEVLNDLLISVGGFEHNLFALDIVCSHEKINPSFAGLNLLYETREGLIKHCAQKNYGKIGELADRFKLRQMPSLEAQLANLVDELTYVCHDLDDGFKVNILAFEDICTLPLLNEIYDKLRVKYPKVKNDLLLSLMIKDLMGALVMDVINTSKKLILARNIKTIEDVRLQKKPLINFSEGVLGDFLAVKKFLYNNFYNHQKVKSMNEKAHLIIKSLYMAALENASFLNLSDKDLAQNAEKKIGIGIAKLSDREALEHFRRLFG